MTGTALRVITLLGLTAAGCATSGAFVREPSDGMCQVCDPAQVNPEHLDFRLILVGDAGAELGPDVAGERDRTFAMVRSADIAGKTAVVFLGDNVYPDGLPPPDDPKRPAAARVLENQLSLVGSRSRGVFVPGNHDWDKSGPEGLDRVRDQARFVSDRSQGRVRFEPADGCPGPTYIDLGDELRLVLYDSEWLLRHDLPKNAKACFWGPVSAPVAYGANPIGNGDFGERLRQVLDTERTVVLAAHHPLRTEGEHGGKHRWWHYAALGYPLLRHWLVRSDQDISGRRNGEMRSLIHAALSEPRAGIAIHASGHEHGLQVFSGRQSGQGGSAGDSPGAVLLVSGAGSKFGPVGRAADTLFKHGTLGFMTLDVMADRGILLRVLEPASSRPVFVRWIRRADQVTVAEHAPAHRSQASRTGAFRIVRPVPAVAARP